MRRRKNILDSELASLADGSMPPDRRREIEDQLTQSASARDSISQQRSAVEIVRRVEVEAPASLHRAVSALVDPVSPARASRRAPLFGGAAVALAAAVLAVVLISGGGADPQKIDQAAQLAQAGPQLPAPAKNAADSRWLNVSVGGVPFPYWSDNFGWHSYGARNDRLGGRTAKTVYYRNDSGRSVAYTIVGGPALSQGAGTAGTAKGFEYRASVNDGTSRVVWTRGGHTCIITARGVPTSELKTLID